MTHLIIGCNELCNCVEDMFSRIILWTHHRLELQLLLEFLIRAASLFFLLHRFPNTPWNGPMIDRYVIFFTPLLVKWIVLTDM